MKKVVTILWFLSSLAFAQEETLDPSIFDGTGKDSAKAEPQTPSGGEESSEPPSAGSQMEEPSEATGAVESTTYPEAEEEAEPKEIILPGGAETEETPDEEDPGIPAGQGSSKSRAGETVNSTEKIVPGQAVDFPWDM